jgi:hypothetical protein
MELRPLTYILTNANHSVTRALSLRWALRLIFCQASLLQSLVQHCPKGISNVKNK